MAETKKWHTKNIALILTELHSQEAGLSENEAKTRLARNGLNKLPEAKVDSLFVIFLRQFQNPLIYILFAACLIVFLMGEIIDGSIILAVLLFNAVVGTFQEGKAQNTLLALKRFVETKTTVLRDNKELIIPDTDIVPGDIILLAEGEKVPADARIVISHNIHVDEAALTGESEPVHKLAEEIASVSSSDISPRNMLLKGTHIVSGNGRAVVVATGTDTTIGKIAKAIATIDTEIPLKMNIRHLSRLIIMIVAGLSVLLFSYGIAVGKSVTEMFSVVVSLSVSVIPEGLPIVVTLILATGVWRMSKQNALVKKLQAVEALGQARVIAVDKTGTITKNELVIQNVYTNGKLFDVKGVGYEPEGDILLEGNVVDPSNHHELFLAGKIAALCSNARVVFSENTHQWKVSGDPTEAAMLVFSQKLGINKGVLEQEMPLVSQIPFDYKLKYQAILHGGARPELMVAGAPETILGLSEKVLLDEQEHVLTEADRKKLEVASLALSRKGLRIIALATHGRPPKHIEPSHVRNLTLVALFGMKDALRPEVAPAMARAREAGMRVVMITGDHKITAEAIAQEAGIFREGDRILTGSEVDSLTDVELAEKLADTTVFARVNPEHKLKIINAYRKRGEIVAMTGDGVNDAPSLVAADLGVAMGNIGTEVAKEASDIILLDDNFGSIVSAIEEGRSIYKTIKKVILYLFAGSWSQVLTILGALFLGFPLPLLAAQIIWLNFVTDGFLDVSLAMEPKEKNLLKDTFERPKKYLIDALMVRRMAIMAIPLALGTLILFSFYYEADIHKAWTVALTTLAVGHWINAWNCRSERESVFTLSPWSNKFLVGTTILIIALQFAAIYTPLFQSLLRTTALSLSDWLLIIPVAASVLVLEEIRKLFSRKIIPRVA